MKKIVVVTGPTASGKTALAIELALRFGGEVVSADSMQIYRGMDIGTAKPDAEEMRGVAHHMLDVAEPGESYSAARYAQEASDCVEDIASRGRLPIICGGTGLYINALIAGHGFAASGEETGSRERLERLWDERGAEHMMQMLRDCDPDSAARLHINDKKRILRALEVFADTGDTITSHNLRTQEHAPRYDALMLALAPLEREMLYERIDRRVDMMLERGLEAEVRNLYTSGKLKGTAAQAIGYRQFIDYFEGRASLEDTAALIKQKSRNYAKRQLTWLRADERVSWIETPDFSDNEEIFRKSTKYIREFGLK